MTPCSTRKSNARYAITGLSLAATTANGFPITHTRNHLLDSSLLLAASDQHELRFRRAHLLLPLPPRRDARRVVSHDVEVLRRVVALRLLVRRPRRLQLSDGEGVRSLRVAQLLLGGRHDPTSTLIFSTPEAILSSAFFHATSIRLSAP